MFVYVLNYKGNPEASESKGRIKRVGGIKPGWKIIWKLNTAIQYLKLTGSIKRIYMSICLINLYLNSEKYIVKYIATTTYVCGILVLPVKRHKNGVIFFTK